MSRLRDALYVQLVNLAVRIAPPATRDIHDQIVQRGMDSLHESYDARIKGGDA